MTLQTLTQIPKASSHSSDEPVLGTVRRVLTLDFMVGQQTHRGPPMAKAKQKFERMPDGRYRLKGKDDKLASGAMMLIFGLIALGITTVIWLNFDKSGGWIMTTCCGIMSLLLVGLGAWMLISGLMVRSKIYGAAVALERWPLRLGERFNVEYEQQAKRHMKIDRVTLELICQEWVRYRQGTDTRTDTKDVYEHKVVLLESGDVPANWRLTGTTQLEIPSDRMHSFDASNNKIKWLLRLQTEIASWPDYKAEFPLEVAARLAPEAAS